MEEGMNYIDGHSDYLSSYSNKIMRPSFNDDYEDFAGKLGTTRRAFKEKLQPKGRNLSRPKFENRDYVPTDRDRSADYLYHNYMPPYYQEFEKRRERYYQNDPNPMHLNATFNPSSGRYEEPQAESYGFLGDNDDSIQADRFLEQRSLHKKLNNISTQLNYMWVTILILVIACVVFIALSGAQFIYNAFKGKQFV